MITFAKGVTSGYLPLGGVVVAGAVAAPFFGEPGGPMLRHGATYAGHPTCCAAAMAVLDAYEAEDLIERGRELEGPLHDALAPLAEHPAVGEVRAGLGLLARRRALRGGAAPPTRRAVAQVAAGAREAGVLVRPLLRGSRSRRRSIGRRRDAHRGRSRAGHRRAGLRRRTRRPRPAACG